MRLLLAALIGMLLLLSSPLSANPLVLSQQSDAPIGQYLKLLQESGTELSPLQALSKLQNGLYTASTESVISFGIEAPPLWLALSVENDGGDAVQRRLLIENAWLDRADIYFVTDNRIVKHVQAGDRLPFASRELHERFFAFDYQFAPGATTVLIRAELVDPMVLPLYLLSIDQANERNLTKGYGYGFLYGALASLLAYNLLLFAGLRDNRYLLYSLYLASFLMLNMSYTGHAYKLLWPESSGWQQLANPLLMITYIICGLLFANRFLELDQTFPRLRKLLLTGVTLLVLSVLWILISANQLLALQVAFGGMFVFPPTMIALGILALSRGGTSASYFLLGSLSASAGGALTTASVWGYIPFDNLTFHAVEAGMVLDAVLLAMALAYRFRVIEHRKTEAEVMARRDPLTGLHNRRAFFEQAEPVWNNSQRHHHNLCLILLDIDHFKRINDRFGHADGDKALIDVARAMNRELRSFDILARWGGEEFILLLPETSFDEGLIVAERIRLNIQIPLKGTRLTDIELTASIGVATNSDLTMTLASLIKQADQQLYAAKSQGRNKVCGHLPSTNQLDTQAT